MTPVWLPYLPRYLADDILAQPDVPLAGRTYALHAVVLFADVAGFTALSEALGGVGRTGTEELTNVLNHYFDPMIDLIESYGGVVGTFGGDALTVLFPYYPADMPDAGEPAVLPLTHYSPRQATLCALHCALAMQQRMARYAELTTSAGVFSLEMKAGLAQGSALMTLVGDPDLRLRCVITGDVLHAAGEAESHAQRGEVAIHSSLQIEAEALDIAASREGFVAVAGVRDAAEPIPLFPLFPPQQTLPAALTTLVHPVIVERLRARQASFINEHRTITVLFVQFSAIQTPDSASLQAYFARVVRVIDRYDGYLNKIAVGDKGSLYIAVFGAPLAHEDDAERALRCALELRDLGGLAGIEDGVCIGISSGVAYCGHVGSAARREYTVMGDTVNLAARLMQAAYPEQVFVSAATSHMLSEGARQQFIWEPLAPLRVKGKSAPIIVRSVHGLAQRTSLHLNEPEYALPLVGRANELRMVEERLASARHGQGQIVGVMADAGMGKSRLAAEIIRLAHERGFAGYGSACQSYGTTSNYLVWHDMLRALLSIGPNWSPAEIAVHLEDVLAWVDPSLVPRMPLLSSALNVALPDNELMHSLDARLRKESLEALVVDLVRARAQSTFTSGESAPLLLVFEDCHWLDPLSADLLAAVGRVVAELPVLVLVLYRPPEIDRAPLSRLLSQPHATELHLAEFSPAETSALLDVLFQRFDFGLDTLDAPHQVDLLQARIADLKQRLVERSQGNPFYIEELVNLIEDQGIDPNDPTTLATLYLPDSVQRLVISRIDQLSEGAKTTLKVASVIGRLFKARWLWGVYPNLGSPEAITANLNLLSRMDLVPLDKAEPEPEYIFKHSITRDVAYESLAVATRVMLHEQVGAFIERTYADDLEPMLSLLAYHYGESRNTAKQRTYFWRTAQAAQDTYANDVALMYYERLLPLVEQHEAIDVHLGLGTVRELVGQWEDAANHYTAAVKLGHALNDQRTLARAHLAQGKLLAKQGDYTPALRALHDAQDIYGGLADDDGLSRVLPEMSRIFWQQGKYTSAQQLRERSLALCRTRNDMRGVAQALNDLGTGALDQRDYPRAKQLYGESLAIRRQLSYRPDIAASLNNLGIVARLQGDIATARDFYEQCLLFDREVGDKQGIAMSLNNLGLVAREQGDYTMARERLEESLQIHRDLGDRPGTGRALGNLGSVLALQGNLATAHTLYSESLRLRCDIGDMVGVAYALSGLMRVASLYRQAERAARLVGITETALAQTGAMLEATEQALHEQGQATARSQLGQGAYTEARAVGLALALDAGIAYALHPDEVVAA